MRWTRFVLVLMLAAASAAPIAPDSTAKPKSAAKKEEKATTGLFAAAKRFFTNFHRVQSAGSEVFNRANPMAFAQQYKKMQTWWCAQPGNAEQRICMVMAKKPIDKTKPGPKPVSMMAIRTAYCEVEQHKESIMCRAPMGAPMIGGMPGHHMNFHKGQMAPKTKAASAVGSATPSKAAAA